MLLQEQRSGHEKRSNLEPVKRVGPEDNDNQEVSGMNGYMIVAMFLGTCAVSLRIAYEMGILAIYKDVD